jgi:AraC-like DNA-binding protein
VTGTTGNPPVLQGSFATRSPAAARDFLRVVYADHQATLPPDGAPFQFTVSFTQDGGYAVDRLRYCGTVQARTRPSHQLLVVLVRQGLLAVADAEDRYEAGPGQALLLGPDSAYTVECADLDADVVRIESGQLFAGCEELTGVPDPTFRLSPPLDADRGRQLAATVGYLRLTVLDRAAAADELLRAQAFRMLLASILTSFPNRALDNDPAAAGRRGSEPAIVGRAVDYIEAHAAEPIAMAQIAAAAGIGVRGLQMAFRRYRDMTPAQYLRRTRLENAHNDLVNGDARIGDTVAAIATRWGFVNHGAFAAQYRQRYGCLPGSTLRA